MSAYHQDQKSNKVSDRYSFINTWKVDQIIRAKGFEVKSYQENATNKRENEGFQTHLIRYEHPGLKLRDRSIELILLNNHLGQKPFNLMAGVFEFACSNGLIVGNCYNNFKVYHKGFTELKVMSAVNNVVKLVPKIKNNIEQWGNLDLTPIERAAYARAAISLRYQGKVQVDLDHFLIPKRSADRNRSLWSLYNNIQEKLVGGEKTVLKNGRNYTFKKLRSIDNSINVNKGLWEYCNAMGLLKEKGQSI